MGASRGGLGWGIVQTAPLRTSQSATALRSTQHTHLIVHLVLSLPSNPIDPMTDQVTSEPVVSASSQDRSSASIDDRVQRTDAHLSAWRDAALERRKAWDEAQSRAAEEAHRARVRLAWRGGLLLGVIALASTAALLLRGSPAYPETQSPPEPPATPTEITIAPEVPPSAPPAAVPQAPSEPVTVPVVPAAVPVVEETVRTWRDGSYTWVYFEIGSEEAAWMRWRDAAGNRVLEDMYCAKPEDGVHRCTAGRSARRLASAIEGGALEGEWTVEVCTQEGCTPATTLTVDYL